MTWKKGEEGEIIATPGQMRRFAIDKNFDADPGDPRNARYLIPLGDPRAEELARAFADTVHCIIAHDYGFADEAASEECFAQCLVTARKYSCEPEFAELIWPGMQDDTDPEAA